MAKCDKCEAPIVWATLGERWRAFDEPAPVILGKRIAPPPGVKLFVLERGEAREPTAEDKRLARELQPLHMCGRR